MAVTPEGTPYVLPGDAISDYPVVSLALGEHIDKIASGIPVGMVVQWGGVHAPQGWLLCDGKADYRQADYPALYEVMRDAGFPHGGSTVSRTFAVPNMAGRVAVGSGNQSGIGYAPGQGGGDKDQHVLEHDHNWSTGDRDTGGAGGHNHEFKGDGRHVHGYWRVHTAAWAQKWDGTGNDRITCFTKQTPISTSESGGVHNHLSQPVPNHTHRFNISGTTSKAGTGNNGVNRNMQPYIVFPYIILARSI